ncbi:thioredoxin family protein [Kangiella taiwanensis]|uniref:Thioredoxin family protein n=1 Tax=Kangiella taiwanensis TaxID=1079179 RepID=A0ABP8HSW5_9GAMM|nr:thioredoxin family protein [Kangiella taiwanensis]
MMKLTLLFILSLMILTGCKTTETPSSDHSQHSRFSQHMDAQGPITINELQSEYPIFAVKRQHELNTDAVYALNQITTPTQIIAFFGTWCHDSQREIPNLLKLKKALNNPNIQLQLIALDRQKTDNQGLAEKADVEYTPTIIVYQNQEELGRIVETTSEPIELELLNILRQE